MDLQPCPFCGYKIKIKDVYPIDTYSLLWTIVCNEYEGGCNAGIIGETAKEVIEKWNKRINS